MSLAELAVRRCQYIISSATRNSQQKSRRNKKMEYRRRMLFIELTKNAIVDMIRAFLSVAMLTNIFNKHPER